MKHSGTRALQMEAVSSNDSELIAYIIDLLSGGPIPYLYTSFPFIR